MQIASHVAIVGGGISGLSAAWEAARRGALVTLLERDEHWGGKVLTTMLELPPAEGGSGTCVVDMGPESFITRKPAAWDLAIELGMGSRIQAQASETRNIYVLHAGKPVEIPLSPTRFLRSPLLSTRGKLRLAAEPFIVPRRDEIDESLADFASRRLGSEALERFLGPILGGIYNTDPERQSIMTTSPVMREIERDHGSLFVGTLARARRKAQLRKQAASRGESLPPSFMAFAGGAQELTDELVAQLSEMPNVSLRNNTTVRALRRLDDRWLIHVDEGASMEADAVILATPANVAAYLVSESAPAAARLLAEIRHASIGTATLLFRKADLEIGFPISGLMIPRRERRAIDAVTFTSERFPDRVPQGYALIRVFFGGSAPQLMLLDDAAIVVAVRSELNTLLGIDSTPLAWTLARWPDSYPQADVGHLQHVAEIEASLPNGLYVTGSAYRGLGVPDCIAQGRDSACLAVEQRRFVPAGSMKEKNAV